MNPERDSYEALLESLADGADVDWAALEAASTTSAERRRYRNLRLVARVAELHRTLTLEDDDLFASADRLRDVPTGPPSVWGHLHVRDRIASGAYGEIYVAHDPNLKRDVALKILRHGAASGRSLEQLLTEARTLARVHHANVVTIHGADVRDGRAGLWMELVHGQTLESWLDAHGLMGSGEVSVAGIDVCRALAAVHGAGLVHGDIKAQNVMRESGGRIVLMDFGAGRAQGADTVGVAGTPLYLAPEVLAGEPPSPRSDIYSVGVLLFHLLTGAYPCDADDLESLRAAHADGRRIWLRDMRADLSDTLVDAIERALDRDPARRFATAGEMERALSGIADVETRRGDTRPKMFAAGVAAAVFLAVVVAVLILSRSCNTPRAVALADVRTIGVLPIADLTDSAVPPHFVEGLTDELIATLGQVQGLTIKPAASANGAAGPSLADVARTLNVDALLQTTMSPGDNDGGPQRLRVRAKLIAAGSQSLLWTESFERPRGATLELPAALAGAIARAVHVAVSPADSSRRAPRAIDPAAEEAYLQGLFHLGRYGAGDAEAALAAFQRALQHEPNHAGAHAGAAHAHLALASNGADANTRARTAALREIRLALEADEQSVEAHTMLAYVRFHHDWDFTDGEREFQRSIELNRNDASARVMYADSLAALRRFDDALAQVQEARRVDPTSGEAARRHALILYYQRDYDGAEKVLEEAERLDPSNASVPLLKARLAEARGQFEQAVEATTAALDRVAGRSTPLRLGLARRLALAGHREAAIAALQALESDAAAGRIHVSARDRGYMYLALGDRQKALNFFAQAVAERDPTVVWFAVDPRVDTLRAEPRFRELLKIVGLPVEP